MAAAFSPPFFSPRQNQPLDVASTPHFGAATLGDVSEEEPLSGILAFTKYDRAVTYTWAITPSTEKLTVGATLPVPYDALDIGATVEAKVPLHVSDSTECSGPDTGSGQFLGGEKYSYGPGSPSRRNSCDQRHRATENDLRQRHNSEQCSFDDSCLRSNGRYIQSYPSRSQFQHSSLVWHLLVRVQMLECRRSNHQQRAAADHERHRSRNHHRLRGPGCIG